MSDANFVEYGQNAVGTLESGRDFMIFASENGDVLGAFIAFLLMIFFIFVILIFVWKIFPKIIRAIQGI